MKTVMRVSHHNRRVDEYVQLNLSYCHRVGVAVML